MPLSTATDWVWTWGFGPFFFQDKELKFNVVRRLTYLHIIFNLHIYILHLIKVDVKVVLFSANFSQVDFTLYIHNIFHRQFWKKKQHSHIHNETLRHECLCFMLMEAA